MEMVKMLRFTFIFLLIFSSCGKDKANQPPDVQIIADSTEGNAPFEVHFSAQCNDVDGECVEYEWDFGDGSEHVFSAEAVHTYNGFGEYTVKLIVKDNAGGEGTAEQVIRVSDIRVFYPGDGDKIGWWEPSGSRILIKAGGLSFDVIEKMEVYLDGSYLRALNPYGGVYEAYWWADMVPDGEHRIYAKATLKGGKEIITKENKFITHNSIDVGGEWISSDFQTNTDSWYGITDLWKRGYIQVLDLGDYPQTGGQSGDMAVYLEGTMSSSNRGISSCLNAGDPGYTRIHVEPGQVYELVFWWWMYLGFGLDVYIFDSSVGTILQRTLSSPVENSIEFIPQKTQVICMAFYANGLDFFLDDIHFVRTQ
jgi:PKD repeat protein